MLKKNLLFSIFFSLIFCIVGSVHAEMITSTQTGGFWDDPSSWNEGKVPGKNDSVEIFGTMFLTNTVAVDSMHVHTGAILKRHGWWYSSKEVVTIQIQNNLVNEGSIGTLGENGDENVLYLKVEGTIKNQGIISDNLFGVYIGGDIENTPTSDWKGSVYLYGASKTKKIQTSENFLPRIYLGSDIILEDNFSYSGVIDLGGNTLYINGEKNIFISEISGFGKILSTIHDGKGQTLKANSISGILYGKGLETNFEALQVYQYIEGVTKAKNIILENEVLFWGQYTVDTITIKGNAKILRGVQSTGDLIIERAGTLKRYMYSSEIEIPIVKIDGDISNFGKIGLEPAQQNETNFIVVAYKNLSNYGSISGLSYGISTYGNIKNTGTIDVRVSTHWGEFSKNGTYIFSITGYDDIRVTGVSTLIEKELLSKKDIIIQVKEDTENATTQIKRCINSELCEGSSKSGGGGVYQDVCPKVEQIQDIHYSLDTPHLQKLLKLTWSNPSKEKVRVIRTSPEYEVFEISQDTFQEAIDNTKDTTYSYFIVSYNACTPGIYSNQIKIPIPKEIHKNNSKIFISNIGNNLSLQITKDITIGSEQKYSISCASGENTIFEKVGVYPQSVKIPSSIFDTPFSCIAKIYNSEKQLLESEVFSYIPTIKTFLNNAVIVGWLTNKATPTTQQEAFANYPHLALSIDLEKKATYGDASLLFANILGNTYIEDTQTAFHVLQSKGYIASNHTRDELLSQEAFFTLYSYIINHKKDFEGEIQNGLNSLQLWKSVDIGKDISQIYQIQQSLKKIYETDREAHDILLKCFSYEVCTDVDAYIQHIRTLHVNLDELGISYSQENIYTLEDYVQTLYKTYVYILKAENDFSPEQETFLLNTLGEGAQVQDKVFDYTSFHKFRAFLLKDNEIEVKMQKVISYYASLIKNTPENFEEVKKQFKDTFKYYLLPEEIYEEIM